MKKNLIITGVALALASSVQAQDLIAAMDFSNASAANYSDLPASTPNDGAAAAAFGSFAFQDGPGNIFPATQIGTTDLGAGLVMNSVNRVGGFNDEIAEIGGGLLAENPVIVSANGGFFEFSVTPGGPFENYSFGFAAGQTTAGTSTFGVSADFGGGFQSLGNAVVTEPTATGGEAFTFDASGLGVATAAVFRVDFTDIAAGTGVVFDNIQVSGTVVPEPSTYAAIAGVLALALVAIRRRK